MKMSNTTIERSPATSGSQTEGLRGRGNPSETAPSTGGGAYAPPRK